jgi:hypothetical protein
LTDSRLLRPNLCNNLCDLRFHLLWPQGLIPFPDPVYQFEELSLCFIAVEQNLWNQDEPLEGLIIPRPVACLNYTKSFPISNAAKHES